MKFGMHRVIDHLRPVTIIKIETQRRFPQNGDKLPKFVVFCTISTIKDEKSAAKFHYIKTASSKVVAQSIAFRVVLTY